MCFKKYHYEIEINEFVKVAAVILTAFVASNARTLHEGIDESIFYHYSTHYMTRCNFSIHNILSYTSTKSRLHLYIPYLIYKELFNKLYMEIQNSLTVNPSLALEYINYTDMPVGDYIIALQNDNYMVYEV